MGQRNLWIRNNSLLNPVGFGSNFCNPINFLLERCQFQASACPQAPLKRAQKQDQEPALLYGLFKVRFSCWLQSYNGFLKTHRYSPSSYFVQQNVLKQILFASCNAPGALIGGGNCHKATELHRSFNRVLNPQHLFSATAYIWSLKSQASPWTTPMLEPVVHKVYKDDSKSEQMKVRNGRNSCLAA